ncbi:efflux RND transporter permease subunit [Sphingomonas sp. SORGH_AS_0950]|uniref:efflux RND transporter permease subunit n=1 Tax=Sphingomonas sp. SORGH_AS_0950 TaxID=3041792 RepID=UPI0027D8029C|nr:efflux RND transporter permease subunit [Sphingomonas sp. SORGH_AS_0950]
MSAVSIPSTPALDIAEASSARPTVSIFANCSGATPQTLNDSVVSLVQRALSSVKNLLYFESSADTLGLATITVTVDRRGSGQFCPRSCDPSAVDGRRRLRSAGKR